MSIFDKITERVGDIVDEVMLPEQIRRAHDLATSLMESGDYSSAVEALSKTLVTHPNVAKTHFLIGQAHFQSEAFEDAIDALERASQIRETPRALFYAGLAYEELGKYRDAQRYFARASSLGPNVPFEFDLEYGLARVSRKLERNEKAIRHFQRALEFSEDGLSKDEVAAELADTLCDVGNYEAASEAVIGVDEDVELATLVRARLLSKTDPKGAHKLWQKALRFPDAKYRTRAVLGAVDALIRTGDFQSSTLELDRVNYDSLTDSQRAEVDYYRGLTFEKSNNFEMAAAALDASLTKEPLSGNTLVARGRVGLQLNASDADNFFSRALEQHGDQFAHDAYFGLGQFYEKRDDFLTARQMYAEAQRFPGDFGRSISQAMGELSMRFGDAAQAVLHFRDAKDADAELQAVETLRSTWNVPEQIESPDDVHQVLRTLGRFLSSDPRLSTFVNAYQEITELMSTPLSVAVLGEFNAGKSTVVNALVGEDVTPVGVVPTTAQQSVLQFGPRKTARVVMTDETADEMSFDDAKKLMKSNADDIERIEFTYPHPQLRVVNFWDTPGFNALHERHEQVARRALETAEAILWVMDANQVLSQSQLDQLEDIKQSAERLIVIINKADRVYEDQLEHLKGYVREHIGDSMLDVFGVSAKNAPESSDEGFETFQAYFDSEIVQRAGRLKALEAKQRLRVLDLVLSAFQSGAVQQAVELKTALVSTHDWVVTMGAEKTTQWAKSEVETLTDWSTLSLQAIESEIAESLKPVGTWSGKLALRDDDRAYLLSVIASRLDQTLDRSFQRVVRELAGFEAELSERVTSMIQKLPVANARSIALRYESYFDETRKLKILLDERVYGRLRAEGKGKVQAAGATALKAIEYAQTDRSAWRSPLRTLIPDFGEVQGLFEAWFVEFFETTVQFCNRLQSELDLLHLESDYRLDVSPFSALFEDSEDSETNE